MVYRKMIPFVITLIKGHNLNQEILKLKKIKLLFNYVVVKKIVRWQGGFVMVHIMIGN